MIVDLRDYRTAPGARDRLIERCEAVFFPEQERLGATFLGQFRDAGDPDRFVWLRGMPDLPTRRQVLTAFYVEGPLWQAQRQEVNAWIAEVAAAGGRLLATLATDPSPNNFPRHPIREGEHGLVWLATFAGSPDLELDGVAQRRLLPTAGSRLR